MTASRRAFHFRATPPAQPQQQKRFIIYPIFSLATGLRCVACACVCVFELPVQFGQRRLLFLVFDFTERRCDELRSPGTKRSSNFRTEFARVEKEDGAMWRDAGRVVAWGNEREIFPKERNARGNHFRNFSRVLSSF